VPLYYTGLNHKVNIAEKGNKKKEKILDNKNEIELSFTIGPEDYTWYAID
jgi:hypothetical protein